MDSPGHQFLARATLAPDEHSGVRGTDSTQDVFEIQHGLALTDQSELLQSHSSPDVLASRELPSVNIGQLCASG